MGFSWKSSFQNIYNSKNVKTHDWISFYSHGSLEKAIEGQGTKHRVFWQGAPILGGAGVPSPCIYLKRPKAVPCRALGLFKVPIKVQWRCFTSAPCVLGSSNFLCRSQSIPRRPYYKGADVPSPCIHMRRATIYRKLLLIERLNVIYFGAYIWQRK